MTSADPRCERARLLLSLRADGVAPSPGVAAPPPAASSPDWLDAHLAECAACRRAAQADRAVGDRLRERAAGAVPAGFAAAVVAAAVRERVAAAAQNRFLRWAAAAAVFVAATAVGVTALRDPPEPSAVAAASGTSARDAARAAMLRPRAAGPERK